MKLRNKLTGEIYEMWSESANLGEPSVIALFPRGQVHQDNKLYKYNSLAELNSEWEDVPEEPKGIVKVEKSIAPTCVHIEYATEEEAEKAVEKLRALKRLKDKGFRFIGWQYDITNQKYIITMKEKGFEEVVVGRKREDLDLLFSGGEE